jgi:hypothetical protein
MARKIIDLSHRRRNLALLTLTGLLLGMITAGAAVTEKRDFRGRFEISFYKKNAGGGWVVADKWISDVSFSLSVADVATGKEFTANSVWEGRTEKGRSISARLVRAGKTKVSLADGKIEVELPFEVTVDGKRFVETFKASIESTAGATGAINGRRAVFNQATKTVSLTVVGSKEIRLPAELGLGSAGTISPPADTSNPTRGTLPSKKPIIQPGDRGVSTNKGTAGPSTTEPASPSATEPTLVEGRLITEIKA